MDERSVDKKEGISEVIRKIYCLQAGPRMGRLRKLFKFQIVT